MTFKAFLRFVTGSSVLTSDTINVSFNALGGAARWPIVHTCSNLLELSNTYCTFLEFVEEFTALLSQDACQRLMLHPYITASEPPSILYYLMLNSGIGYQEACSKPCKRGFVRYMPSPFYPSSVVLFQLHGGMVSHMQVLATHFSTVHNTNYSETILVLVACS